MDAILTTVPWGGLGWGGLIFVAILSVIRGDLVPRRTHDAIVDGLRETVAIERDRNDRLTRVAEALTREHGTTVDRVLSALPATEGGENA